MHAVAPHTCQTKPSGQKLDLDEDRPIQVSLGSRNEGGELAVVLTTNFLDNNYGGSLLVDDCAEAGLALDDHVWYAHLATQSWKENNKLDGVNIVRNNNEGCFFGLYERSDMIKAVLRENGFFRVLRQR
jgi:hypothetical protein